MDINTIEHDQLIYVYSSNLSGVNSVGAAGIAKRFFGAVDGIGEGMTGENCYALPTKDERVRARTLDEVCASLDTFLQYAKESPSKQFMLTRIGSDLTNFSSEALLGHIGQCAIPGNVHLPGLWLQALGRLTHYRVIVAGGREFTNVDMMEYRLDKLFANLDKQVTIIDGTARGADAAGYECAHRLAAVDSITRFPANWNRFDKPAGFLRNAAMAWHSTHAVIFWDGISGGSKDMIKSAEADKLTVRVCRY
jgi:hypothetical protein